MFGQKVEGLNNSNGSHELRYDEGGLIENMFFKVGSLFTE